MCAIARLAFRLVCASDACHAHRRREGLVLGLGQECDDFEGKERFLLMSGFVGIDDPRSGTCLLMIEFSLADIRHRRSFE